MDIKDASHKGFKVLIKLNPRFFACCMLGALLGFPFSADAVEKNKGAYHTTAKANSATQARMVVTGPAHPALFDAQGGLMDPRSKKTRAQSPTAKGVQLQRYQMKLNPSRFSLKPSPVSSANALGRNWVAPLPQPGNDYLRGMYLP
jgi:hypothetical protein